MIVINNLIRSKRKTLALIVESDGTLTVRAPLKMKETDIQGLIDKKKNWIQRKQVQALRDARFSHQYAEGEKFWYLGKEIPLRIVSEGKPALVLDGEFKLTKSFRQQAEALFVKWYKKKARLVLKERISHFARSQNIRVKKFRISSARTRWGSCSTKGTLSFTWRLVLAPLDVIDYVVVHELCHLMEMNHSKAFWTKVGEILPDYQVHRKWLKDYGAKLQL